jgi:hypothetical protein
MAAVLCGRKTLERSGKKVVVVVLVHSTKDCCRFSVHLPVLCPPLTHDGSPSFFTARSPFIPPSLTPRE